MRKKRVAALIMAVAMSIASLAGCGGNASTQGAQTSAEDDGKGGNTDAGEQGKNARAEDGQQEDGQDAEGQAQGENAQAGDGGQIELTLMGGAHLVSVAEIVLKDYLAEHPNIKINFEKYSYAEYPTKMKLQLSNNESTPDIMIIHDLYTPQFAKAGYLEDLSGMVSEGDILPVTAPAMVDGKLYGLPNQVTNQYVYLYRQDIYDQEGLMPPATFDEYYEQGLKLKEKGYYVGAFDPADPGCSETFRYFIYMLGGEVLDNEGNVSLNKGVEALELMKKCSDAGIWHTSQLANSEAYWTAFNDGQIAAFPAAAAQAAYYETNVDPNGNGGYGHLAMAAPMKFAEDGRTTFINNTEYYAINKNTEHMDAAKEVVAYLALSEEATLKFSNVNEDGVMAQFATGSMAGIEAIVNGNTEGWKAYGDAKIVEQLANMLLEVNPDMPFVDERSNEINTIISEVIGEMFLNGAYTPAEAVDEMRKRIDNI